MVLVIVLEVFEDSNKKHPHLKINTIDEIKMFKTH